MPTPPFASCQQSSHLLVLLAPRLILLLLPAAVRQAVLKPYEEAARAGALFESASSVVRGSALGAAMILSGERQARKHVGG